MIDDLDTDHVKSGLAPGEVTHNTPFMHFYDRVVAFERGAHVGRTSVITGGSEQIDG